VKLTVQNRILSIVHLVFLIKACLSDRSTGTHSQAELGAVGGTGKVESYPATTPTPVQYGQQPAPYGAPQQTPYGAPQQAPYGAPQQAPAYGAPQQQPYPTQ
jgi:hypothetical protein